jgi:hypothetical protein
MKMVIRTEIELQESKLQSPDYDGVIGRIRHNAYDVSSYQDKLTLKIS